MSQMDKYAEVHIRRAVAGVVVEGYDRARRIQGGGNACYPDEFAFSNITEALAFLATTPENKEEIEDGEI
ncbi:hypothetical protein COB52_04980 [Candidatus Kaiserbacteria bacterium]|nr:MAG: hypothetical protein COB52_04980 [Candidatus Kaiserbacteria bacterium]